MNSVDQSGDSRQEHLARPTAIRWLAAVLCITYGAAKITGSQFTILDSELARPLGQVSGFWLTWYYFGYSHVLQDPDRPGGDRRRASLGGTPHSAARRALVLLPVMVNIVVIDICFGVDLGATVTAIVICACLVSVIRPHAGQLRGALLLPVARMSGLQAGSLGATAMLAFAVTYWAANYNNRLPTRIDGVWSVVPGTNGLGTAPAWRQALFERNRAYWVTFRSAEGKDEQHHFEMDGNGNIQVWERWLKKGTLLMQGQSGTMGGWSWRRWGQARTGPCCSSVSPAGSSSPLQ
jgi:hypothetical protein